MKNLQELSSQEIKNISGGQSVNPYQIIVGWLVVDTLNNPKQFLNSFLKGFNF